MAQRSPKLITDVVRLLAAGKISPSNAVPVLKSLTADEREPIAFESLLQAIREACGTEATRLIADLRTSRLRDAARFYAESRGRTLEVDDFSLTLAGLPKVTPADWHSPGDVLGDLSEAVRVARERRALEPFSAVVPVATQLVASRYSDQCSYSGLSLRRFARELIHVLDVAAADDPAITPSLLQRLTSLAVEDSAQVDPATDVAEIAGQYLAASDDAERLKWLDRLCSFPGIDAAQKITEVVENPLDQDRAEVILTCRFGPRSAAGWPGLKSWLGRCERQRQDEILSLQRLFRQAPDELVLMWLKSLPDAQPELIETFEAHCRSLPLPLRADDLLTRYGNRIPQDEWQLLTNAGPATTAGPGPLVTRDSGAAEDSAAEQPTGSLREAAPDSATDSLSADSEDQQAAAAAVPATAPVEQPPQVAGPSLWNDHIQPFLTEQWYLAAGVLMVLVGSSLLAYYTWDKHWAIRYTLMPSMLGLFTWALAWLGNWVERRDTEFVGTAATLRAAAIGLLPINFMAIAVLSNDPQVAWKPLVVPLMSLAYLGLFGFGLRIWCGGVHPRLATLLGTTLLGLNSLVMIGPLARTLPVMDDAVLRTIIGVGFYIGFAAVAFVVMRFSTELLDRDMAREQRVPWFVGATLVVTFLQVMLWVHGYLRHVPLVSTYAVMVILTGGLVLFVERRAQSWDEQADSYRGESFIGFAFVLLGLLMGMTQPYVRILGFVLGGIVWLTHGRSRRDIVHDWIGLTLLSLGGASIGLLDAFPKEHLPGLGLALAAAIGLQSRVAAHRGRTGFQGVCRDMQAVVLMLTSVIAVLTQWEYQTPPHWTGGWLLLVVAGFYWRAWHDGKLRWVHSAMTVMAIALPYLGCVNFAAKTLQGNVIAFGLGCVSLVWLLLTWHAQRASARAETVAAILHDDTQGELASDHPSLWTLILQARSTVIWVYGSIAVAAMVLRVLTEMDVQNVTSLHMAMDYSGPLMMAAVLAFGTWFSRSLIPAAMAAVIVVILFPEIRATFAEQFAALGWGSGLGSAGSGLGLIVAAYLVRPAAFLRSPGEGDRFMNRTLFPLRRYDHTLFTWPLLGSAVFLTIRTDSITLLQNLRSGVEIRTAVAVLCTAASWTLLAVYFRRLRQAAAATYLGLFFLLIAIILLFEVQRPDAHWAWSALCSGLLLQLLYSTWSWLANSTPKAQSESSEATTTNGYLTSLLGSSTDRTWCRPLLATPTRNVLHAVSLALTIVVTISLLVSAQPNVTYALIAFLASQLCWHGIASGQFAHGSLLFVMLLVSILARTAPGNGYLLRRISYDSGFLPLLCYLVGIQLLVTILEFWPKLRQSLRSIAAPVQYFATSAAIVMLVWGVTEAVTGITPGNTPGTTCSWHLAAVFGLGLLTARLQSSLPILSLSLVLGYCIAHIDLMAGMGSSSPANVEQRLTELASPWRLSLFALIVSLIEAAGQRIPAGFFGLTHGRDAQIPFRNSDRRWLILPGLSAGVLAACLHTGWPYFREQRVQLIAPFVAAVAWGITGWSTRCTRFYIGAGILTAIGNIHVVRVYLGDFLRPWGISEIQLICLGIAASLLEMTVIRLLARNEVLTRSFNRASLGLAGLIMSLIAVNYIAHPDLSVITGQRFAFSGALAWLSALYFRRAARRPMPGEEPYVAVAEGMHHLGITVAIWCGVLVAPVMRRPELALMSLGFPLLYFWLRAETGVRNLTAAGTAYRNSATVLSFGLLFAYVFRFAFQMVMFPGDGGLQSLQPLTQLLHTEYYHSSAPFIGFVAVVMLRLHGLGGTSWLPLYGGPGLVVASFFAVTWLPGLSPFDEPAAAAWTAIALAHFWTLVSDQRSPLRSAVQRLAQIDSQQWAALRHIWGLFTITATHVVVAAAVAHWPTHPLTVAPLLAGAATVVLHQGIIRGSVSYLAVAGVELLAALHCDFLVDSYIHKDAIVWVVLGFWFALLAAYQVLLAMQKSISLKGVGTGVAGLACITFAHVLYHRPWSTVGLWSFAAAAVLSAATPRSTRHASNGEEHLTAALLAAVPAWLTLFSQGEWRVAGAAAVLDSWTLLSTTAAVLLTGGFATFYQSFLAPAYDQHSRPDPRLFDQTLCWFAARGKGIHLCTLALSFAMAVAAQVTHHNRPFEDSDLGLLMLLYAGMAFAWFREGRLRHSITAYVLLQLSVLGFFSVGRRQLMLTTDFWTPQYDVWASLVVSAALTGFKQHFDLAPREARIPLLGTLLALPVVALTWTMWNDLGTDVAMLVVGLHSLMFAFMGRDNRESPYNLIATAGFVAFVFMLFWSRLQFRVVHAYTIPVGLGVLMILHLLRDRVNSDTRNRVRLVTLLVMLGSVGYYALLDTRYPIAFHGTMLGVCLLSMMTGSLLRIRLYVVAGFVGLVVDLASIVFRFVAGIDERGTQMTIIGSLVLLTGIGLVLGAIYFKTHRDQLTQRLDHWKRSLGDWE